MSKSAPHIRFIALAALVACAAGGGEVAQAAAVTIGTATGGNCIPFGCGFSTDTHYQQVYSAASFGGPININEIDFFHTFLLGGNLASATYTFSLSHSAHSVDALDTTNFANNIGADNTLFGVFTTASIAAPSTLKFLGTSFNYDGVGDLLLDIQVSGFTPSSSIAAFDAMNGDSGGVFSRAHNFGTAFNDYGLVTRFAGTSVPEPGALALVGVALLGASLARRRGNKA